MAKAKTKKKATRKKAKRAIKCSKCQEEGHNARTCKAEDSPKKETKTPPPPVDKITRKVDARQEDSAKRRRPAPTEGNEHKATPYACPRCSQIGVLVIVKVKDHNKSYKAGKEVFGAEMRCEKCFQKPPTDLIVKWGAAPGDKCELPSEDD